jgi:hypothetical protein
LPQTSLPPSFTTFNNRIICVIVSERRTIANHAE